MIVRKVRGQCRVGKVTVSSAEVALCRNLGLSLKTYVKEQLISIAKKRKWEWYLKENT